MILSAIFLFSCSSCDSEEEKIEPKQIWKTSIPEGYYSYTIPNATTNTVVFATSDGEVHGYSTKDGKMKWEKKVGPEDQGIPNKFMVYDNDIFFDYTNLLFSFDDETGNIKWVYVKNLNYGSGSSPEPSTNYVFTGDAYTPPGFNEGNVYCVNRQSGALVWKRKLTEGVEAITEKTIDDLVYVGTRGFKMGENGEEDYGKLHCFKASTGDSLWTFDFTDRPELSFNGGAVFGKPAVWGNYIYITTTKGATKGAIVCLNRFSGEKIWATNTPNGYHAGVTIDPISAKGYAVANLIFYSFDLYSGNLKLLEQDVLGSVLYEPIIYNHLVYLFTAGGSFQARKPEDGKLVYESINKYYTPLYVFGNLVNGVLYMISEDHIYALEAL